MQPHVTGSQAWEQSQQVQNSTVEHVLLFSADASKNKWQELKSWPQHAPKIN